MASTSGSRPEPTSRLEPEPETVDALLAATVRVIEDERSRGDTADTKAGQLVGFIGVILAVDAALGRDVFDQGISGVYSDLFVGLFALSLASLVAGAFIAIRGLLRPQQTLALRRADVERFADGDLVLAESIEVKRTLIRTYGAELVAEEDRNNRKLSVVNRAGLLLMIGVFALAGEGATLAVEHLGMSSAKNQPSSPPAPSAPPKDVHPPARRPKPPAKLPLGLVKKGGSPPSEVRK